MYICLHCAWSVVCIANPKFFLFSSLLWTQSCLTCSRIERNHCFLFLFVSHYIKLHDFTIKMYLQEWLDLYKLCYILLLCFLIKAFPVGVIYHVFTEITPRTTTTKRNAMEIKPHHKTSSLKAKWKLEWQFR